MAPRSRLRRATRHPVTRTLLALVAIGVGVSLIVSSMQNRTQTLTARVFATHLPFSDADKVDFEYADGTGDDEVSPGGLFDAVEKFGPGPARVTRNADSKAIYKVAFHGKTYTLGSPGGDLGAGIAGLVLGLLGLAYVVLTSRGRRGPAPATGN